MKFLFNSADAYLQQSDWRDFALIKSLSQNKGI